MGRLGWTLAALGLAACSLATAAVAIVLFSGPDCGTFREDAAALRHAQHSTPTTQRVRAETLVLCGHLVGRTPAAIAAELGPPDRRYRDYQPRLHSDIAYNLPREPDDLESSQLSLFMEVEGGRVVYAAVEYDVKDGKPVG